MTRIPSGTRAFLKRSEVGRGGNRYRDGWSPCGDRPEIGPGILEKGQAVPANRSRTLEWRRCLQQIQERNGCIEIMIARQGDDGHRDLVWRVRVLDLREDAFLIEQPRTLDHVIELQPGLELVAVMSIGQNRWTFRTSNLGPSEFALNPSKSITALRLRLPESVERCQRRNYYRLDTVTLHLPHVDVWPLLDPKSVIVAERCNEMNFEQSDELVNELTDTPDALMPEVGPKFRATILNIGGGGMGLLIEPEDTNAVMRHKLFWMRFSLNPDGAVPICATGKLVHHHMESSQQIYAGIAFDFSFNPAHQRFVVDQICRHIALQQRMQFAMAEANGEVRRSA